VDQLDEMMNNKDFILINVHVPYEGEISQTDLLIPFNAIEKFKNELPNDKDAKIVLYRKSGQMSRIAAEKLTSMGYTQVHNFQDGMRDWRRNGKQILYRSG
jgi:rhodanese-related sulfurtransferase